jgi:hypothetical protein
MDRNQRSMMDHKHSESKVSFGLPQINRNLTKGSVSFGASRTMHGAKSALGGSPVNINLTASKTI